MIKSGEELRDAGVSSVNKNTPEEWKAACRLAIARLASTGETFTAEDVRKQIGDPPNHANAMGAQFIGAAKEGIIQKVGYAQPMRPSSHARCIASWRGTNG